MSKLMEMGKSIMPMSKDGLKLDNLKTSLGIRKKKTTEMCEVTIKGPQDFVLKMFGLDYEEDVRSPEYCG